MPLGMTDEPRSLSEVSLKWSLPYNALIGSFLQHMKSFLIERFRLPYTYSNISKLYSSETWVTNRKQPTFFEHLRGISNRRRHIGVHSRCYV